MDFRNLDVTVTLKGEEWFALMTKLAGKPLSDEGRAILRRAQQKLGEQVTHAAEV